MAMPQASCQLPGIHLAHTVTLSDTKIYSNLMGGPIRLKGFVLHARSICGFTQCCGGGGDNIELPSYAKEL